jgi:hypothetical protein
MGKSRTHRALPFFDPLAASLAAGPNEVCVAALEMQFQLVGSDDLVGHAEFWQFEPSLNTLKIHAVGFLLGGRGFFPHFARHPAWVNIYLSLPILNTMR